MQRYFISKDQVDLPLLYIKNEDCHHIKNVMRMKINDKVYVTDEESSWIAKIVLMEDGLITLEVVETLDEKKEMPYNVTIAQGIVRKEKMEEVIDYITEMGAAKYLPVEMERSIVKVQKDKMDQKMTRFQKIAKEASEQSHRMKVLKVENIITFKELLKLNKEYDLCLYAYEASKKDDSLKELLRNKQYQNILVLVGPEGGISDKEVKLLKEAGFMPITLGPRILRTQVAPLYVMAALSYEWEI